MEYRKLGQTGLDVSVLGVGTSAIGFAGVPGPTVRRIIDEAIDHGVNVIDTAECYRGAEAVIGETMSPAVRSGLVVMTKCGHEHGVADWSSASILRSLQRSLTRLRTDVVDVAFLHGCPELHVIEGEVVAALEEARRRGYIRFLGYSGDGRAALAAAASGRFDVLETSINVADLEAVTVVLPEARARGLGVVAKRPLANVAWQSDEPALDYHRPYWERLRRLNYEFADADLEAAAGTALRFTTTIPGVHTAIVGTTRPGRIGRNALALSAGPLPPEALNAILARWSAAADAGWCGLD